ncbi:ABC transporter substrate-binding protein [Dactylosporangium sp. AC04546]|uniref:ABC transporter substrate-binding protein n=1 Tax=Dactylosporangium sp. AC04546 TaxID=2862460 RepID=UPI001EDDAB6F|nr:ABC transporter substrate-binding protein [Dactylosporangium sp. AC04546]WVK89006.1 ABC transporter substrate-binding protein [Dactylosporangium sp. AC04546]
MRQRIGGALVLTTVAAMTFGCSNNVDGPGASDSGPFKLGVVLEVTGAAASIGVGERNAVELAVDRVNAEGGVNGRQVKAIILDAQSREDQAAKYASQLVDQDRVHVLIGSTRSGPSLAMRPIAERAGVPMISLAAAERVIKDSRWVFKTPPSDRVVVAQLADFLAAQGYRRVGLLRDSSAFGEGVREELDSAGKAKGITVVAEEKFDPTATQFSGELVRLRAADAQANIIWGSAAAPALATKAYRELGITAPLLSSYGVASASFLSTAGAAADGMVLNGNKVLVYDQLAADDPQRAPIAAFVEAYRAKFGAPPSPFAGYAWDAVLLAVDAAKRGGTQPEQIRQQLETSTDYVGVTGAFTFSAAEHSGLPVSPLVLLDVRAGAFVLRRSS